MASQFRASAVKQLPIRAGRLFARLDEAVTTRNAQLARELLARANATAAHDRIEDEDRIAGAAVDFAVAQPRVQGAANAERAMERAEEELAELTARAAFETVRRVVRDLRHRPRRRTSKATLYSQAQLLVEEAAKAGKYVTVSQHQEIDRWIKRAEHAQAGAPAPTAPARTVGKDPVSSKPRANAGTGTAEQSDTITVWVWKDRYGGGLHAADTQTRPEASVRHDRSADRHACRTHTRRRDRNPRPATPAHHLPLATLTIGHGAVWVRTENGAVFLAPQGDEGRQLHHRLWRRRAEGACQAHRHAAGRHHQPSARLWSRTAVARSRVRHTGRVERPYPTVHPDPGRARESPGRTRSFVPAVWARAISTRLRSASARAGGRFPFRSDSR